MVLQQGQPISIRGSATPDEHVTVRFAGGTHATIADTNGQWSVAIPAQPANVTGQDLIVEGNNQIILKDVLIGEVWLCSGQSNMAMSVSHCMDAKHETRKANYPLIRNLNVSPNSALKPLQDVNTKGWTVCSPNTVEGFSAVSYFFARRLQDQLTIPIGIITASYSNTRIEPWISPEGYQAVPELKVDFADKLDQFPVVLKGTKVDVNSPLAIYNAMIAPLTPLKVQGILWYQGESNVGDGFIYHYKMEALIQGWRNVWNRKDMPFYFVQLAPCRYRDPVALPKAWNAQLATLLRLKETGMVVTTDLNPTLDLHPTNKQDVGHRLALWALTNTYEQSVGPTSGPLLDYIEQRGNELVVHFQPGTADGLHLTKECDPSSKFEISSGDGQWTEATARVENDTIVLNSTAIPSPKLARFAWNQLAKARLFNSARLPASPFTSDM